MQNRLYRSRSDVILGGVCSGLGKYLGIDPWLVRIFFVLLALASGAGVWIYLLLWLIVPGEGAAEGSPGRTLEAGVGEIGERAQALRTELGHGLEGGSRRATVFIGSALIVVGVVLLVQTLDLPWLRWLDLDVLWPVLLIVAGGALIWRWAKGGG